MIYMFIFFFLHSRWLEGFLCIFFFFLECGGRDREVKDPKVRTRCGFCYLHSWDKTTIYTPMSFSFWRKGSWSLLTRLYRKKILLHNNLIRFSLTTSERIKTQKLCNLDLVCGTWRRAIQDNSVSSDIHHACLNPGSLPLVSVYF